MAKARKGEGSAAASAVTVKRLSELTPDARNANKGTARGDGVYDPFGGSGTTIVACEKTARRCFMMEIDPIWVDVIVSRWEKASGKKAWVSGV
jgi:hypothetical protein